MKGKKCICFLQNVTFSFKVKDIIKSLESIIYKILYNNSVDKFY